MSKRKLISTEVQKMFQVNKRDARRTSHVRSIYVLCLLGIKTMFKLFTLALFFLTLNRFLSTEKDDLKDNSQ